MMRWVILLIATLVIAHLGLPAANHIGHERSDHRCGPSVNCSLCNKKRCCSASGYCGSGDDYCGVYSCAYDCPFDPHTPPCKPYASSFSDLASGTGDVGGERANCAVIHVNMSMGWIQQHGPAVFCGRQPASNGRTTTSSDACGNCLKVTRRGTGSQKTVRLLEDDCSRKGPMLGHTVFQELDGDGKGADQGYLTVDIQSLPCNEDSRH